MFLTIHRVTHEIGGTCIELRAGATRIIVDAGLPLVNAAREPFDARSIRGRSVMELLQDGLLPLNDQFWQGVARMAEKHPVQAAD